jgi:hypothetical protein
MKVGSWLLTDKNTPRKLLVRGSGPILMLFSSDRSEGLTAPAQTGAGASTNHNPVFSQIPRACETFSGRISTACS